MEETVVETAAKRRRPKRNKKTNNDYENCSPSVQTLRTLFPNIPKAVRFYEHV